jgi:hypothetical protein
MDTKEIVATLKAELVGPFEFLKDRNDSYHSDFIAQAPVKVGTLIHTETFRVKNNYTSSFTDDQGVRHPSTDTYVPGCTLKNFRSLTEAGIAIDSIEIDAAYEALLPAIKEEIKEAREAKRSKAYKESWIHKAMLDIPNDPKIAKVNGLVVTIGTYTPYSDDTWSLNRVHLKYRDHTTYITREHDTFKGTKYVMDSGVFNNYRESRMGNLTNSVMKFVNGVDSLFKIAEEELQREKSRKNAALSKAEKLSLVFGIPVKAYTTEEGYDAGYRHRRQDYKYRKVTKYYTMDGEKQGREVDMDDDDRKEVLYRISGLGSLTLTQAQSIMKILVDGSVTK